MGSFQRTSLATGENSWGSRAVMGVTWVGPESWLEVPDGLSWRWLLLGVDRAFDVGPANASPSFLCKGPVVQQANLITNLAACESRKLEAGSPCICPPFPSTCLTALSGTFLHRVSSGLHHRTLGFTPNCSVPFLPAASSRCQPQLSTSGQRTLKETRAARDTGIRITRDGEIPSFWLLRAGKELFGVGALPC